MSWNPDWKPISEWSQTVNVTLGDIEEEFNRRAQSLRMPPQDRLMDLIFNPKPKLPQEEAYEFLTWSPETGFFAEVTSYAEVDELYDEDKDTLWTPWPTDGWNSLKTCPRNHLVAFRIQEMKNLVIYRVGYLDDEDWIVETGQPMESIYDTNESGLEDASHIEWRLLPPPPGDL